jgi:hypothetical protein
MPVWLTGILDRDASGNFNGELVQGLGTHFGADFDAAAVQRVVNGTLTLTPFACKTGSAQFQTAPGQLGLVPSSLALQRITIPLGLADCPP